MPAFKTTVTYSESGWETHSPDAIRRMVSNLVVMLKEIRPTFKNPFKGSKKEKIKFFKKLKELAGISKRMQKGKMFYKCERFNFKKSETQGLIINRDIKNQTHLISTNTKNFSKETFFFSDKIEVIALKGALSKPALKGQSYLFDLHNTFPLNVTRQCKIGALPAENHICRGAKDPGARKFLGTNWCDNFKAIITGRSCKILYKNEHGREIPLGLENPCSRATFGSGKDPGPDAYTSIRRQWEAKGLEPNFNDVLPFVEQYLDEMELITKEYLPYFFGKHHHDEFQKELMKKAFFDSNFQLTTNLVNRVHLSGGHVDTNPQTKNFPSIISIQTDRELEGEGELAFPSLGFRLQYQTGDVVFMRPDLFHGICAMKTDIDRYSAVFYNNHTNFRCK